MSSVRAVGSALSLPWSAFVAAFLYYAALTLMALGVAGLSGLFVAVSYLLPVAAYLGFLVTRGLRALAGAPVELWPASDVVLH